jgi:hypothetical protein
LQIQPERVWYVRLRTSLVIAKQPLFVILVFASKLHVKRKY